VAPAGRRRAAPAAPAAPQPDLLKLLADPEARVRRRAALAVGRVGLPAGVEPLVALLRDAEPEVRQMAAFALGLIGDRRAVAPLEAALKDPSRLVQSSAEQALGLIGDPAAAAPMAAVVAGLARDGSLAAVKPDDPGDDRNSPAGVFLQGVSALARLKAYDALAGAVLSPSGQPLVRWWPVAYALQWVADPRAIPALRTLLRGAGTWTPAFAARGLGTLHDAASVEPLIDLVKPAPDRLPPALEAVRALGEIGDPAAAAALVPIVENPKADAGLRLEAVTALGGLKGADESSVVNLLLDVLSDPSPAVRGAALGSVARLDPSTFLLVLSGLDPDPQWSVRADLARALVHLPAAQALPRLTQMLGDRDLRVIPAVLATLVQLRAPGIASTLLDRLKSPDPYIRKAAALGLEQLKPAGAVDALKAAYASGLGDATYVARAAALEALVACGGTAAEPTLRQAFADKDWAVRVKAADLMHTLDPSVDVADAIRPVPTGRAAASYAAPALVDPTVSPELFIDTDKGTIEVALDVLDAPLTIEALTDLARRGFFDHVPIHRVVPDFVVQGGDPRGDGDGGPGFTIRDELNEQPYLPGTVGMALDWRDTGGSQFFICLSPQPRLDAGYTVFGHVVQGMDVVTHLAQWDVIERVRVWNGKEMTGG
ncbi:MAG: HEAT repeat domain-containing protein, partial [Acidobacteriota bacterium]|nr:HEAT repeat domain-containing protein [Acidobacteriota bacterium]